MIGSLITILIYVVIIGLVCWLLTFLVDAIPLPEPFNRVAKVVIMVVGILIVLVLLLQFVGAIGGGLPSLR